MNQQQAKTLKDNPVFQAFLEGKEIEHFMCNNWCGISTLAVDNLVNYPSEYRIKVKKLPEPPIGEEWVNFSNIDADTLGEGYRLCLKSEMPPCEHGLERKVELWSIEHKGWDKRCCGDGGVSTYRTKEPLPQKKPLTFKDIPIGSAVRFKKCSSNWELIDGITNEGIRCAQNYYSWDEAMSQLEIKFPNGDWQNFQK